MDFTKGHPTYQYNRFFIEGEPEAMLMVEFLEDDDDTLDKKTSALIEDLKKKNLGYAFPVVKGEQTKLAWDIRKAGLGLIRNMPGDTQPVNLIEDCAVSPEDLPFYIEDLQKVLRKYELTASYYAHAGAGELHVEPMINLKTKKGKEVFRNVLKETTELVKKYNGSLSGEHGDGRLRGEFISSVLGEDVYKLLEQIKNIFDPKGVFNAGKIVNTPPMNQQHRYEADKPIRKIKTVFNFDREENILHLAEKCSGSGDCRRTHLSGGTMCPSYMATRQEKDTTRARANTLRQFLTDSTKENPFDHPEIKEVMDLCLSCKACKSECPTNVDITKLKAEFLQHYYDAHGVPFRSWLIANFTKSQQLGIMAPPLYNAIVKNKLTASLIKKTIGFAVDRSLPTVGNISLRRWHEKRVGRKQSLKSDKKVHLFCDEFTNYNDVEIGKKGILLLEALGYEVMIPQHEESGRTYLSKGLVRKAQKIIIKNIEHLSKIVSEAVPLVGIEPSAILTFRDEAPDLCPEHLKNETKRLAKNSFTLEEFLLNEFKNG
ncbi:MAG TPA: FAD-linked oxidase C-terminal domain-containing protein, partial [Niabella sp.]|nr:FAD-linked oxidase C-terminal domain-containing protein [Niabella sp.]